MNPQVRRRRRVILIAWCALATACATPSPDVSTPSSSATADLVAREVNGPATGPTPDSAVDPESMVVAADLMVSGGDLDQALADGAVTAADVAAARAALADGSLDDVFD